MVSAAIYGERVWRVHVQLCRGRENVVSAAIQRERA